METVACHEQCSAEKINAIDLINLALNELNYLPKGASFLNFTSNHDENSWQGSAIERLHYFFEPLTVLTFLLPGFPLIYSGQEAGNYRRLLFFDKDEVLWKEDKMMNLYSKLVRLKKNHPVLKENYTIERIDTDAENHVLALSGGNESGRIIFIANISDMETQFFIKCNTHIKKLKDLLMNHSSPFFCQYPLFCSLIAIFCWKEFHK
ncbi:MAG: hypothetical protein R2764_06945 [Bacteroidales bacterium]